MRTVVVFCLCLSLPAFAQNLRPKIDAGESAAENGILNQENAERQLGLAQLIQKGLKYSPQIQKAESEMKISKAEFSQTESAIFPTVSARASAKNRKLTLSSFGQSSGAVRQNLYEASLEASQPLYVGGAITSGLARAKLGRESAEQSYFIQKQNFLSELISTYLDHSENEEKLRQAQINRDFLANYAKIAKNYASIGRTKSIDRLQAEANLASSESTILEYESNLEISKSKLLKLIGFEDRTQDVSVVTKMELQPIEKMKLKESLEKALAGNPELKKAEIEVRKQKYDNDLDLTTDRPRLTLDGSYGYTSPNREDWFQEDRNNYTVGVSLTVPLFSGLSSLAKKRAHSEKLYQKEKDLALVQDEIRRSIATAIQVLDHDFQRIKSLKTAVELGRKAMDSALKDYRRGLVSSTDVVQIQNNRFQSEVKLVQASVSYMKQVLSLRKDLGIDLESAYLKE
ncbi:MAG: hypothetical protein CL676_03190 [Bdellovibrionaceae bacterium]|nr:hypothetical protein [Pseudobdellovibrionaceae bacterium]|tara:strand:- start:913 stop:2286 length:1374 start_codon:yes stop_codon:yes gene_type:complete